MLRTDDAGRWTMDDGRWTMDTGRWMMDAGPSTPYYKLTGELKNTNTVHWRLSNIPCLPHSYLFILSDVLMLLGNALMFR